MIDDKFRVKDRRKKDFYLIDNIFIKNAGCYVGPYGCAVYNSLMMYSNEEKKNKECWPSVRQMAKEWKTGTRQISNAIEILEKLNIISVEHGDNERKNNVYQILSPDIWKLPVEGLTVVPETTEQGLTVSPEITVEGLTVVPGETEQDKRSLNTYNTPPAPPTIKNGNKNKRQKIDIDYDVEIEQETAKFKPDIQKIIKSFIVVAASENKTGLISQSRQWSLLCQLSGVSTATDENTFKAALLEAIERKKPNINYLMEIIKTKSQRQQPGIKKPEPLSTGKNTEKPRPSYTLDKGQWYRIEDGEHIKVDEDRVPQSIRDRITGRHTAPPIESSATPIGSVIPGILSKFAVPGASDQ